MFSQFFSYLLHPFFPMATQKWLVMKVFFPGIDYWAQLSLKLFTNSPYFGLPVWLPKFMTWSSKLKEAETWGWGTATVLFSRTAVLLFSTILKKVNGLETPLPTGEGAPNVCWISSRESQEQKYIPCGRPGTQNHKPLKPQHCDLVIQLKPAQIKLHVMWACQDISVHLGSNSYICK